MTLACRPGAREVGGEVRVTKTDDRLLVLKTEMDAGLRARPGATTRGATRPSCSRSSSTSSTSALTAEIRTIASEGSVLEAELAPAD